MNLDVVVVGSANLDLVLAVPSIPRAGETLLATETARHCGGKGLNQAIAAARAGARTGLIGAVGADEAGAVLREVLDRDGVDTTGLRTVDQPSGTAVITVDSDGENAIVVAAGANDTVNEPSRADVVAIAGARVLVAQLEVPLRAVERAAEAAQQAGTVVLLNAAPAQPLGEALLAAVDVLVVNEHECRALTEQDETAAAARVLARAVGTVVVTLGPEGAIRVAADGSVQSTPAPHVEVVDTTGAGDAFTGHLAAGLAAGLPLDDAIRRGAVAGALAVGRPGAEPSLPTAAEVDQHEKR